MLQLYRQKSGDQHFSFCTNDKIILTLKYWNTDMDKHYWEIEIMIAIIYCSAKIKNLNYAYKVLKFIDQLANYQGTIKQFEIL